MVQFLDLKKDNLMATIVNGELKENEVKLLLEKIHRILESNDKVRWYFEMIDFEGWSLEGLWDDLKRDTKHANDHECMAMVVDKKWQHWMAHC